MEAQAVMRAPYLHTRARLRWLQQREHYVTGLRIEYNTTIDMVPGEAAQLLLRPWLTLNHVRA